MFRAFALIAALSVSPLCDIVPASATEPVHQAHLEIIHGKPFVTVFVNGKGPFRFVLDTGTGGEAFVSSELAQQLSLPQTGKAMLNDPSGKGSLKVATVLIDSLQVAGVEFTGVKAAVHNLGNAEGPCQGLLGFALFRNLLLTLDYPNQRMILGSGDLEPDGEQSVLPFRTPDGIPVVTLAIGKQPIDAQLDSGGAGLSLPSSVSSKLKFASRYTDLSNAHSLSTRFVVQGAVLDADVHLGSYTFKHPFVEINPAFPLANFGSCPMQEFLLTFDQKNGLVRFSSHQRTLHLSETPVPMRLQSMPDREPPDPQLVPVS